MNWIGWVVRPFRSAYYTPHHAQHHPAGHVPRPDLDVGSADLPAADPRRLHRGRKALAIFWLGIFFLFIVPALLLLWLAARSFGVPSW